ncbi:MAG: D-2-hydroxyacid dehydrogenase [Flavobacteriales bacterium]|nr:D-2-hydroxyacid dehydrogenase [Flavobacteriales bacterium]
MKILANDGIDASGKEALEAAGFTILTEKVAQENLSEVINRESIIGLLVRSATTARKELIDACPGLKFIGRGGVGIDNIDAEYARSKGVQVFNTPAASSQAVAELVMSMFFAAARGIYDAGARMPHSGHEQFEALKKKYAKGMELRGKTLGIIGLGRIGQSLAAYATGCGMNVIFNDNNRREDVKMSLGIPALANDEVTISRKSFDELIRVSDFISIHVPKQPDGSAVIGKGEIERMKKGVILANTARGGVIDEKELLEALSSGKIRAACLDVFVGEPKPSTELLSHPAVISTPHIGASTSEAQERIGTELAQRIMEIMNVIPQNGE